MAGSGSLLKDELFNEETVHIMAQRIKDVYGSFDSEGFSQEIMASLEPLELKDRMITIGRKLEVYLPKEYDQAVTILTEAAKGVEPRFIYGSFCEYVRNQGCTEERLEESLKALGQLTGSFSAEFAIRKFLNDYPEETFDAMMAWSTSEDTDQRRLASEGLRPKLPWGENISMDYKKAVLPLWHLYSDKERYVTRSVANHLNDISKVDPDFVLDLLSAWVKEGKQEEKEMAYIISHSTRTLVKQGHSGALALMGYHQPPEIEIKAFEVMTPELDLGDSLEFSFDIYAEEAVKLMIDYIIDYPMAKGRRSKKVFKIKKAALGPGEVLRITKKHPFRAMTTKKLYPGEYTLTLQINGILMDSGNFLLNL